MSRRSKRGPSASDFLKLQGVKPIDARQRLAERDARMARDTRTELQKWLGDPPPDRSALTQVRPSMPKGVQSASGVRVDLWRK
jgi:hypothetical protein